MSGTKLEVWNRTNTAKLADLYLPENDPPIAMRKTSFKASLTDYVGGGDLELPDGHPNDEYVQYRNVVRLADAAGDTVGRWSIDEIDRYRIAISPQSNKGTAARGRGLLSRWDDGIVLPWMPLESRPISKTRVWNYASPTLDDSGWAAPYRMTRFTSSPTRPVAHTDPVSDWIYARDEVESHPAEITIYRRWFTLSEPTVVGFYYTADDRFRVWIDGTEVESEIPDFPSDVWVTSHHAVVALDAGNHLFCGMVQNDAGPGAFIASAWPSPDGVGLGLDPLWVSGVYTDNPFIGTWKCANHTVSPVGFTAGQILIDFLAEVQARDGYEAMELSCTTTTDSAGNLFDIIPEVSVSVGANGSELLKALEPWCEFDINENSTGIVTHVYNRSSGFTGTTYVAADEGVKYLATHGEAVNAL